MNPLCLNVNARDALQDSRKPCIATDVTRDIEALVLGQKYAESLLPRLESLRSLSGRIQFVPMGKIREAGTI